MTISQRSRGKFGRGVPRQQFWSVFGTFAVLLAGATGPAPWERLADAAIADRGQPVANPAAIASGVARFDRDLNGWYAAVEKQLTFHPPAAFRGAVVRGGDLPATEPVVALTFDDGPHPRKSERVLDLLAQSGVKVTFFLVGQNLEAYPEVARRMVREGHAIGNHTWSHRTAPADPETAAREIDNTDRRIRELLRTSTRLYRPPEGRLGNGLDRYARDRGYATVLWSADTGDWADPPAQLAIDRAIAQTRPGGIVLLHDGGGGGGTTLAALPETIRALQARGYRFVTVPELLALKARQVAAATP